MRIGTPQPVVIATLEFDAASFDWLNALRKAHFPPARNVLDAHLTLFHRLAPEQCAPLAAIAPRHAPIPLTFAGIKSLGGGVAIVVQSEALLSFRAALARAADELCRQDRQRFAPHVSVQNKATVAQARALFAQLDATFSPRTGSGNALLLWDYLGGPWRLRQRIPFEGE